MEKRGSSSTDGTVDYARAGADRSNSKPGWYPAVDDHCSSDQDIVVATIGIVLAVPDASEGPPPDRIATTVPVRGPVARCLNVFVPIFERSEIL